MTAISVDDVVRKGTGRSIREIEPPEVFGRLRMTNDLVREEANLQRSPGWPMVLSSLTTWLRTGQELSIFASLR